MTDTPFSRDDLNQSLYKAIQSGNQSVVQEALDSGATMDARDRETGRTVLFAIIDRMADIADGSDEFDTLTMTLLNSVTFGVDPNIRDKNGVSALNYTLQKGNFLVPDLLLVTGAEPDEKFPGGGDTPMHIAVRLALEGKGIRLLNTLLTAGADPTVKNDAGISAYDLLEKAAAKPEDATQARAMLSHAPQVQALIEAERAAQQDKLRDNAKRFKLGGP